MFCCKSRSASFSPAHELDSVIKRNKRGGSQHSVVSNQPKVSSERPSAEPAEEYNVTDNVKTSSSPELASNDDANKSDLSAVKNDALERPHSNNVEHVEEEEKPEEIEETNDEVEDRRGRRGYRAPKVDATKKIIPSHPKSSQVAEAIKCAILNNQFLNDVIPDHIINKVVETMAPRDVQAGEVIIKQGEIGDKFFVNEKGSYQVIVNNDLVVEFQISQVFGELAVLYNQRRAATVQAATAGRIWMIDGAVYKALMINDARYQEEQRLRFLREVRTLNTCSIDKLQQIAKLLKQNFYPTNTNIVNQGEKGDKFFIIKAGKVTITKNGEVVARYAEGEYFGEKALTETDVRQATCVAEAPGVTCLELSRNEFIDTLGDFEDFTTKQPDDEKRRSSSLASFEEDIPPVDQLQRVVTIGEGGFGRVMLVKVPNGNRHYALKMLPKIENNSKDQRDHVINEKNIHKACKSFFIVQLYKTYADSRYLYFLMEACMGGDLFSHMQRQKGRCFSEDNARFIAGCILEALGYMHQKNFIYRDLKPENMLIDYNGYIKLADFGFAKTLKPGEVTYTFAGTPEYVAPEVIYNKGHNRAVDYWAFGIFVFELLAGKTPFKSKDPSYMITYGLILKGIDNIQFPRQIGKNANHLIKRLCRLTPHERLGCQKRGVDDIRNHKWFQTFKWSDLQERKIESNFKPKLDSPFDTIYFDDYDEDYPEPKCDISGNWDDFDS